MESETYYAINNCMLVIHRTIRSLCDNNSMFDIEKIKIRRDFKVVFYFSQKYQGTNIDWIIYEKVHVIDNNIKMTEKQLQKMLKDLCQESKYFNDEMNVKNVMEYQDEVYGRRRKNRLPLKFFSDIENDLIKYNTSAGIAEFTNLTNIYALYFSYNNHTEASLNDSEATNKISIAQKNEQKKIRKKQMQNNKNLLTFEDLCTNLKKKRNVPLNKTKKCKMIGYKLIGYYVEVVDSKHSKNIFKIRILGNSSKHTFQRCIILKIKNNLINSIIDMKTVITNEMSLIQRELEKMENKESYKNSCISDQDCCVLISDQERAFYKIILNENTTIDTIDITINDFEMEFSNFKLVKPIVLDEKAIERIKVCEYLNKNTNYKTKKKYFIWWLGLLALKFGSSEFCEDYLKYGIYKIIDDYFSDFYIKLYTKYLSRELLEFINLCFGFQYRNENHTIDDLLNSDYLKYPIDCNVHKKTAENI
ncbi:hypothetical protein COBT_001873 [Conglomerata obtusa]